jgi:hypothetical protein
MIDLSASCTGCFCILLPNVAWLSNLFNSSHTFLYHVPSVARAEKWPKSKDSAFPYILMSITNDSLPIQSDMEATSLNPQMHWINWSFEARDIREKFGNQIP